MRQPCSHKIECLSTIPFARNPVDTEWHSCLVQWESHQWHMRHMQPQFVLADLVPSWSSSIRGNLDSFNSHVKKRQAERCAQFLVVSDCLTTWISWQIMSRHHQVRQLGCKQTCTSMLSFGVAPIRHMVTRIGVQVDASHCLASQNPTTVSGPACWDLTRILGQWTLQARTQPRGAGCRNAPSLQTLWCDRCLLITKTLESPQSL